MTALQLWLQNHKRKLTQDAIDEALMEYIAHIEKQRDELLAALEDVRIYLQDTSSQRYIYDRVTAAIASAKGTMK